MLVLILLWRADLALGNYYLSALMISYTFLYGGQDEDNVAKSKFVNIFSIVIKPSESMGVDVMSLVCVDLTSDAETREALRRLSWSCFIRDTYYSVKSTIANDERPCSAFTGYPLFPMSDAVQSRFTIFFTNVG